MSILIQLLTAFLGSLGFALVFGMRRRYLFCASLGALLGWGVYLGAEALLASSFLPPLLAAAFAVSYSEHLRNAAKYSKALNERGIK